MFLALFSRFFLLLLMMILLSSILQFKKWFVFLEQWFFANKDSHVCFVFFWHCIYKRKKNVGLGSFFYDSISFLKYTSGFLTDFFFFNYGWARQIRAKPNWKKKWKYFSRDVYLCATKIDFSFFRIWGELWGGLITFLSFFIVPQVSELT